MSETIIFDIQRNSYVDGPGIRTAVFVKGCHLDCAWCHNPEGRSKAIQRMWYAAKCTRCGRCAEKCPVGAIRISQDGTPLVIKERCTQCGKCTWFCPHDAIAICGRKTDTDAVLAEIKKDIPYYEASGGGVTVTGGECMLQPAFVAELLCGCRALGIHTAVDTAGDVPWEAFEQVLPYTDLFLYDIKCITPGLHRNFTGVDNARLLDNYKRLLTLGRYVTVRIPMIPECNANDAEFPIIAAFLREFPPDKVECLPYHAMGENKFRALGMGEPRTFTVPRAEDMQKYKAMLSQI
ncbi:MAG: glycyl-radical enzyme activating protein [Eubacteriales bacterium]